MLTRLHSIALACMCTTWLLAQRLCLDAPSCGFTIAGGCCSLPHPSSGFSVAGMVGAAQSYVHSLSFTSAVDARLNSPSMTRSNKHGAPSTRLEEPPHPHSTGATCRSIQRAPIYNSTFDLTKRSFNTMQHTKYGYHVQKPTNEQRNFQPRCDKTSHRVTHTKLRNNNDRFHSEQHTTRPLNYHTQQHYHNIFINMDFASCLTCSVGSGCVASGSRLYSFSHAVLAVGAFVSSVPFLRLLSGIVSSLMHLQLGEVGLWPALVFPERVQQPAPVLPERVSTCLLYTSPSPRDS